MTLHLVHISRVRIERLIKEDILHPLDFSNSDYCINYIKRKYVKQVKKGEAKQSARNLEIIHMNIYGSFSVYSVDGFDTFIAFMDDFCAMAIFIQLKNDRKCWIN
jgi:hypothetical protein